MNKTLVLIATVIGCAIQMGCATQTESLPTASPAVNGFQQLDKGTNQTFVGCSPCVRPTTKTLWAPETQDRPAVAATASAPPKPTTALATVQPQLIAKPQPKKLSGVINFETSKATLSPDAKATLNEFCQGSVNAPELLITGHTDATGSQKTNDRLANARAQVAKQYLADCIKSKGKKLNATTQSKGRCCYVADNTTESGRSKNRRVEVTSLNNSQAETADQPAINKPTGNEGDRP